MPQVVNLKAKGLFSFPNALSEIPQGGLVQADNVVINRDSVIEPRRGYKLYGNAMGASPTADYAHQLFIYKNRVLRHFGGSGAGTTVQWDNGSGTFTSFSGTFSEPQTGTRIKGLEANGNFFLTTSAGIKKISASSAAAMGSATVGSAGGIKALDTSLTLNTDPGFFTQDSIVAYRILWGIKDNNQNLILGAPSERAVISNPITGLLIKDFNSLLSTLDTLSLSTGINDQNYVSTLKVSANSPASILRTNLIALATKLDNDVVLDSISTASWSANVVTVVYNSSMTNILEPGDKVRFTGFSPVGYNGDYILTSVSGTSVTYAQTTDPGAYVSGTVSQRIKYTDITQPVALDDNPTTDELVSMQTYYDAIVSDLQLEPSGIITDPSVFDTENSTQSSTVNVTFTVPQDVTTAHFYQIYRTALATSTGVGVLSDLDPGDEEQLVFEANPTSSEISAESVTVHDIVPDSFRGANLYTNPNSGEGIAQANEVPPLAKDICAFKNYTFYANTSTKQRKEISLLSVSQLVSGTSTITVTDGTITNKYTFVNGVAESSKVTCNAASTLSPSGPGDYFTFSSAKDETNYYVWYNVASGNTDPALSNKVAIEVDVAALDTNAQVASKTYAAINVFTDFNVSVSTNEVTITNSSAGIATDIADGGTGFSFTILFQGEGEDAPNKKVLISSLDTPSQQVDETARSLIRVINKQASSSIYAFYLSGPDDVPGLMLFESRVLGGNPFYILANSAVTGAQFSPNIQPTNSITANTLADPTVVTSAAHGLSNGNTIVISNSNSTPSIDGVYVITFISSNTFSIPVNVTIAGTSGVFILASLAQTSDNEVAPNRIYYSKNQQPEAVPLVNTIDVGPKDKQILRILALRDSMFILKEEGVYRLSGLVAPFQVALFDSSSNLKGPDTAVVLNNQIYMLSTQGVSTISETGIGVISRPIENLLLKLTIPAYTSFSNASFGVAYETDRAYYLWTVTNTTDTKATQCFRFNTFTNSWTIFPVSKTSGIVNPFDDRLYLGAGDTNFTEQERKDFSRSDYADREFDDTINAFAINGNNIKLTSVTNYSVGDVLIQTQYLTIDQYNRLLRKLDADAGVTDGDYFSTLNAVKGDNLRDKLTDLANKLDTDPGVSDSDYASSISAYTSSFPDTQAAFNVIVAKLNADLGVAFSNYSLSVGTIPQEVIITAVNTPAKIITVQYTYPIIVGAIKIYKAILSSFEWAPQTFGDPSMNKHVREGTILFETDSFTDAEVAFVTDLSPGLVPIPFPFSGNGSFGNNLYGTSTFGGSGFSTPFRTYIPLEQQRCRYINCKFTHKVAREIYSVFGMSFTAEIMSERADK